MDENTTGEEHMWFLKFIDFAVIIQKQNHGNVDSCWLISVIQQINRRIAYQVGLKEGLMMITDL
jgi:hypothetical protein